MNIREYSSEELAGQPIGAWTGLAYRHVVGAIREQLAVEELTQPHWWTLNHVAGEPGKWSRPALTERLEPYEDLGIDFEGIYDDLVSRGWLIEDGGTMALTDAGEAARLRASDRSKVTLEKTSQGIGTADFVTTINVLRRIVANLGGNGNLPE
jgi:hypothetical protein